MKRTRDVTLRIVFDDDMMSAPEGWEWNAILERARLEGILNARVLKGGPANDS